VNSRSANDLSRFFAEEKPKTSIRCTICLMISLSANDTDSPKVPQHGYFALLPPAMVDQTFENRYQNLTLIGEGGMGQVFQAFDTLLQKHVAIKVLTNTLSDGAKIRFQTEARVTARLNHPNIIGILNFGLTDDHAPYMVMEWVDGEDLSEFLRLHKSLELRDALQVFFQIGAALSHAHAKGVIHRDLKPANVLLVDGENGLSIKLLDFGIAKVFQDEQQSLTASGTLLGSPLYMSPSNAPARRRTHAPTSIRLDA